MASVHKTRQHGRNVYRVAFYDKDGERRFIRLGEMGKKAAESIALHVQQLADYSCAGMTPDAEQTAWLDKIGTVIVRKLVNVGLIEPREPAPVTVCKLAAFLDGYMKQRTDVKASTKAA